MLDLKPIFSGDQTELAVDTSFDYSTVEVAGVRPFDEPVVVAGRVFSRAEVVTLAITIHAVYHGFCDRCGAEIRKVYDFPITRDVVDEIHSEDDDEWIVVPDKVLDLENFCFTELVLNLPMKHLCKADCKGLCLKCGANLNNGACGCAAKEIDPRLAALQNLLNEQ